MSLTFQQIILDAKKLVGRISDQESKADNLICEIQSVCTQIDGMKQYQEEVEVLNAEAKQTSHLQVIAGIQQENRHLREIQAENRELKSALEDHKSALELIMSKYRKQTASLLKQWKPDYTSLYNSKYANIITSQAEKINEMAAVMKTAAALDEENEMKEKELIARLKEENIVLRQIVDVANKYGSLKNDPPTENKTVQTDE
ncbi:FGFR1 oncogene partner 2 homolog [Leptopilina heterotoma]|uniref:FGFR1 oncogene partner 2 homolog n=1 Tax=Leptopilina heterotoma TaxID=63436 RepID=UPI001CA8E258|nr:FGFR1 oncogene partner 2 homolog [Leptopilina heterotoma]